MKTSLIIWVGVWLFPVTQTSCVSVRIRDMWSSSKTVTEAKNPSPSCITLRFSPTFLLVFVFVFVFTVCLFTQMHQIREKVDSYSSQENLFKVIIKYLSFETALVIMEGDPRWSIITTFLFPQESWNLFHWIFKWKEDKEHQSEERIQWCSLASGDLNVLLFFSFKFTHLFWNREEREGLRERERERESIPSRLHAVSAEPTGGLDLINCEIMTWAKIESQMLNQLSHPGAPK